MLCVLARAQVIETKDTAFLVLEFLGGGELFHYMHDKRRLSGTTNPRLTPHVPRALRPV